MPHRIDVLCVGYANWDLTFAVPSHPGPDEKARATHLTGCGGGPAANAAVQIARLGGSAAFCGYLGNDDFGSRHEEELRLAGVDTAAVVFGPYPTSLAAVLAKPDGRRAIVDYRGNRPPLTADTHTLDPANPPRVILFDGHEPTLSPALMDQARQLGIPTVLDAGSLHEGTRLLFPEVDYCIASERFVRQWSGLENPVNGLQQLAAKTRFAMVTCSEQGLHYQSPAPDTRRPPVHLPAFPITAVDSTGAGDAFHGAFALGLAEGLPLTANILRAAAVGALTCTRLGARPALPSATSVNAFLKPSPR